ncbi:MAG: flagellar FliJ family protein [Verrucomicrobiota bacterium]
MKPFRFSLQAVRTLRQRQEQMALERFSAAVQIREKSVDRLNSVTQQLNAGWSELKARLPQGATAFQIAQIRAYCDSVTARKKECEVYVNAAHRAVNVAWKNLLSAKQQLEVVVKYYENQKRRFGRELDREEQKTLDDMANRRGTKASIGMASVETTWN